MTYDDLKLKDYIWLMDYLDDNPSDDVFVQMGIISHFFNIPEDKLENMPLENYHKYAEKIEFLQEPPVAKEIKKNSIRIGHRKYNLIKDWRNLMTVQYIDYESLSKGGWKNLPNMIAIFAVPKGHTYMDGKYNGAEEIKYIAENCSAQQAIDIAFFLQKKLEKYVGRTLNYLGATMKARRLLERDKTQRQVWKEMEKRIRMLVNGLE